MNDEQLHAMRHSLAHITAAAVKRLWPDARTSSRKWFLLRY